MRGVGVCVMKCHGGGEGVKKGSNLRYVINEWPLKRLGQEAAPKLCTFILICPTAILGESHHTESTEFNIFLFTTLKLEL